MKRCFKGTCRVPRCSNGDCWRHSKNSWRPCPWIAATDATITRWNLFTYSHVQFAPNLLFAESCLCRVSAEDISAEEVSRRDNGYGLWSYYKMARRFSAECKFIQIHWAVYCVGKSQFQSVWEGKANFFSLEKCTILLLCAKQSLICVNTSHCGSCDAAWCHRWKTLTLRCSAAAAFEEDWKSARKRLWLFDQRPDRIVFNARAYGWVFEARRYQWYARTSLMFLMQDDVWKYLVNTVYPCSVIGTDRSWKD